MKSTILRPLTAEELALCQDLAAMATEHAYLLLTHFDAELFAKKD